MWLVVWLPDTGVDSGFLLLHVLGAEDDLLSAEQADSRARLGSADLLGQSPERLPQPTGSQGWRGHNRTLDLAPGTSWGLSKLPAVLITVDMSLHSPPWVQVGTELKGSPSPRLRLL